MYSALRKKSDAYSFIHILCRAHISAVRIYVALAVHRNIHPLEKTVEQRNPQQLRLADGVKIIRDGDIDEHDVEIRCVIGTEDIRFIFVQLLFPADEIKNSSEEKNKVRPDFIQAENMRKPFAARKQNSKEREENKKCNHRVHEKPRAPEPLQGKQNPFHCAGKDRSRVIIKL